MNFRINKIDDAIGSWNEAVKLSKKLPPGEDMGSDFEAKIKVQIEAAKKSKR